MMFTDPNLLNLPVVGTYWMERYLPKALHDVPLNRLAIPGSHDSGAYKMTTKVAPSAPSALVALDVFPGFSDVFGDTLRNMSTCQRRTIREQLEDGIRYLDFRVSTMKGTDDFYFVHSVYGTKINDALAEMKDFLDKYKGEVIILHCQAFHSMEDEHHKKFISLLKSTFGSKLCDQMPLKDLTLNKLWASKKQVICIYPHKEALSDPVLWSGDCIHTPWPNTSSSKDCIQKLTKFMDEAKDCQDKFSVCQGVLTPDVDYILDNLKGSIHKMTKNFNPDFISWLDQSPSKWTHLPNIVVHDYVEEGDYIPHVRNLNDHRLPTAKSDDDTDVNNDDDDDADADDDKEKSH